MQIGDTQFLLPRQSELQTYDTNGGATDSVTKFSACREYTAESSLRFDNQDTTAAPINIAPAGAIAHGRILQMRRELKNSQFLVSIRFDTLETKGSASRLSIRLARQIKAERRELSGLIERGGEFSLPEPALADSGSRFTFPTKSGKRVVPAGFESKWITIAP
jgi:hypothetical protein